MEILLAVGLAAAAGLKAYIPLLLTGLLARFTDFITLPEGWSWMISDWALIMFSVLAIVDFIADKIPVLDTANDILQTIVRPTSGGLLFSAGVASSENGITNPEQLWSMEALMPFLIGLVIALIPHVIKMVIRPIINTLTAGLGGFFVSLGEDLVAVVLTISAIILPILIPVLLVFMGIGLFKVIGKRRKLALT